MCPHVHICQNMSANMYLYTQFALFYEFGQISMDTLCLHNNTSKPGQASSPQKG